jgi:crotonobetainyl-CoA:carnitine CoA-transferase CaiB-like acyl-CoA transferase
VIQPAPGSFLEGIRVLDCSRVLAGPLATQILGDFGAEVLKVEAPWGDDTRGWGPPFVEGRATYFASCNRNRASLVLDLQQPADRERLRGLAAVADVVVDNFPPARRRRLGLDAASLAPQRPDLIALSVVGYGGNRADDPGYDLVLQAESGLMGITGPVGAEPSKVGVAVVDVLTGMMAANGVLAALVRRGRTGQGAVLSVALLRTALFALVNVATATLATGQPSKRWGNAHPSLTPYEAFATADRSIVVGVGSQVQWARLCDLLGLEPAWRDLDNAARVGRRAEVVAVVARALAARPSAEVLERLAAAGVPAAPILRPDEALAAARGFDPRVVLAVEHPGRGRSELVASPIDGEGLRQVHTAPPDLGEGGEELAASWLARGRS